MAVPNIGSSTSTSANMWKSRPMKIAAVVLLVVAGFVILAKLQRSIQPPQGQHTAQPHGFMQTHYHDDKSRISLVPGELPGYTGWARPAVTLAGHFELVMSSSDDNNDRPFYTTKQGEMWSLRVQCAKRECQQGKARFFARAYGPAVVAGNVEEASTIGGMYEIQFPPMCDVGWYTVEVVLTFSNAPPWHVFPLPLSQGGQPAYEGYLLPDFPLSLQVVPVEGDQHSNNNLPGCTLSQLLVESPSDAWKQARWVVTDKINHPRHHTSQQLASGNDVTFQGYVESVHSIGVQMEYRHLDCRLPPLPPRSAQQQLHPLQQCAQTKSPIHLVFVGDSNMRIQRIRLAQELHARLLGDEAAAVDQDVTNDVVNSRIRASFLELEGGALRCRIMGGKNRNITEFFQQINSEKPTTNERRVVLFNTGLHDIHRLCGQEFLEDRAKYLGDASADTTQGFHCDDVYRQSIQGLVQDVLSLSKADLVVFQTTTAGWPKYGNYGVVWPNSGPQSLPLAPDIIPHFNQIALEVLQSQFSSIHIIDGWWVSYARPDNREIAPGVKKATEKKLSHPGYEVVGAMVQSFTAMVAQSELCR